MKMLLLYLRLGRNSDSIDILLVIISRRGLMLYLGYIFRIRCLISLILWQQKSI